MIGLPCAEERMLKYFATISERDRRTDGQTDGVAISISRVSIAALKFDNKNKLCLEHMT